MSPSNALSYRRTLLRRPIVCRPPPPPPPPPPPIGPPPPDVTCGWDQESYVINYDEEDAGEADCFAYNSDFPIASAIEVELSTNMANFSVERDVKNGPEEDGHYTFSVDDAGEYWMQVAHKWPDDAICIARVDVIFTEENGDDEEE